MTAQVGARTSVRAPAASRLRPPRVLLRVVAVVVAAVVAVLVVAVVLVPRLTGATALTVLSDSMAPSVPAGSVAVIRPVDPAEVRVGDVVTFQTEPGEAVFVTHRVVGVHEEAVLHFTTRGDANPGADAEPVPATAVRGRLWYDVPLVGHLSARVGLFGGGHVLVAVALLGYAVLQVVGWGQDRRRRAAKPPARSTAASVVVLAAAVGAGALAVTGGEATAARLSDVAVVGANLVGAAAVQKAG